MATLQTVTMLRSIWAADVLPDLEAQLQRVYLGMLHAETVDQWRMLQGRGHALIALMKYPEHLAASLTEGNGSG